LIVGVGSIGRRHLRCFQATGRARLSICEINAELREEVGRKYAVQRRYASLETALADAHHAAVIATPAHLHVALATAAAGADCHLLIEKPLATGPEGIDALAERVKQRRLVAMVAYVQRAQPALAAMRRAIAAGRFGRPVHLVVSAGQHFPTYRPAYREIYYRDRATGGGAVQDALTHLLNAGQWLVGPIDRVAADAAHQVLDGVEVEDTVNVIARHGGVLASYSLNQHQAPNEITITVVCQNGTCRFDSPGNRWRWMTEPGGRWEEEPFGPAERDALFVRQADAFLDAMEGKSPPLCTLEEAIHTLHVNLAVLASAEQRAWQTVGSL